MMIQTTVRLPDELYKLLKEEARNKGLTVNGLVVMLLWKRVGAELG